LQGNVYTIGTFADTVDFDPGPNVYNLTIGSVFISKLTSAGNLVWVKNIYGMSLAEGKSLGIDALGNVYITGYFGGTLDFDPGIGLFNMTSAGNEDVFIFKLDSLGNFKWAKRLGGSSDDKAYSLAVDLLENSYTTGGFYHSVDFDPNAGIFNLATSNSTNEHAYILKLDSSGNFVWAKSFTCIGNSYSCEGHAITLDNHNNVYTTGLLYGVADFDPDTSNYILPSDDAFFSKLDSSGHFVWAASIGSPSGGYILTSSIAVDSSYNVYSTGYISGIMDFNPDFSLFDYVTANANDAYIFKLGPCLINSDSLTTTSCSSYTLNGQTYTANGMYVQTLVNVGGCDSVFTLHLTINNASSSIVTHSACYAYTFNSQTYTASGIYTQTFTNAVSCDSVVTLDVTINSAHIGVTQSGITLTANANGANYQWVSCPSYAPISGAIIQNYTAAVDGDYAVIISQSGCIDTPSCYTVIGVGIDELTSSNSMQVSPNPTNGVFNISSNEGFKNASINTVNVTGEIVLEKDHLEERSFVVDISDKAKGIYFIEMKVGEKRERMKIIKE